MSTTAEVRLWGRTIAAVSLRDNETIADFEYDPQFQKSGIEISPLTMPLSQKIFRFPELPKETYYGLPGLLADTLPDKFGHALIDAWLATQGRPASSFNAVERLCYTGSRGMGALEFAPAMGKQNLPSKAIEIDRLVQLASEVLNERNSLRTSFADPHKEEALADILSVGTSAGGARAKAVIAWNPHSHEVRSGQQPAGKDFEYWLLKFDGVEGNRDKEHDDPPAYGVIEYAYALMAKACGIQMSECRLFEENGRRHFMTQRFDRHPSGKKSHMQSLCALAHYDFNAAGAYSYEQALLVIRRLHLPMQSLEEQFRRMCFNIVARNQDDHVKNISFLMDQQGQWTLSPAFDLTYSFNPRGLWTAHHQMTMNGKREDFKRDDFRACATSASIKNRRAEGILNEVQKTVAGWKDFAEEAGLSEEVAERIKITLRLKHF